VLLARARPYDVMSGVISLYVTRCRGSHYKASAPRRARSSVSSSSVETRARRSCERLRARGPANEGCRGEASRAARRDA